MVDLFELLAKADDKEIEELMEYVTKEKEKIFKVIELLNKAFGDDAEKAFDLLQDFMAKKTYRAFEAYINAGFDTEQAFILAANTKVDIVERLRTVGK